MKLPPEKTAELRAENLLSPVGMTFPNHLRNISACSARPSELLTKITPCSETASFTLEYAASLSN